MNITRRDLLKFILAYTFTDNAKAVSNKYNPIESFFLRHDINPELKGECIEVFHAWNSRIIEMTPEQYLSKLQINRSDGVSNLNQMITDDFKNHNIIDVKGLVLSKTEASILASIGESFL
ncbi:MAG: hypothetical protein ISR69_11195 [Gammaproteobacteria bacterium]|nr:hypothetical protein [Gammaproteobacteria bacterium]